MGYAVMLRNTRVHWLVAGLGACAFLAAQAMAADVYQGTASFKNKAGKKVTATVTVTLDKAMAEEDRAAVVEQVKANPDSAASALAGKPQLGTIQADDKSVPIRFASGYALDEGQNLIVLSDEPMGFIGGSGKSKKGFDLTYAMISVKASGEGKGEIRPAARIKWMESGAPAPVGYDNQIVWIENVTKTTKP
jgi:opacity protein-like surface antigen